MAVTLAAVATSLRARLTAECFIADESYAGIVRLDKDYVQFFLVFVIPLVLRALSPGVVQSDWRIRSCTTAAGTVR